MRKSLKGAGAAALAAATIVSGLSFGAGAVQAASPNALGAQRIVGKFVLDSSPTGGTQAYWAPKAAAEGENITSTAFTKLADAQAAAENWTFAPVGKSGSVRPVVNPDNQCLTLDENTYPSTFRLNSCVDGLKDQQFTLKQGSRGMALKYSALEKVVVGVDNGSRLWFDGTSAIPGAAAFPTFFEAAVTSSNLANRTAVINGYGVANSTASISVNGKTWETKVAANGTWKYTLPAKSLKLGTNEVALKQVEGTKTTGESTLDITFEVQPVTATAEFGTALSDQVTVSGKAHPGATVELRDDANSVVATATADANDGSWSAKVPAPNKGGKYFLQVQQTIEGDAQDSVEQAIDYGAAVTATNPVDGATHPGGPLDFMGTGEPKSTVEITEDGKSDVLGTATVADNGRWKIDAVPVAGTETKLTVTQSSKGANTTAAKLTLNAGVGQVVAPTLESPAAGSTVDVSRPTFSGHGEKGAKVTLGYSPKALIGSATVNDQGEWTIYPSSGLAVGESKLVLTQTAGNDVKTLDYTINRVVTEPPFRVTSHNNNQSYAEGETTFRGTSATGASIKAVNQWGTVMGTTTADANGNWAFKRALGPTTDGYDITFSATKGGKTESQTLHLNYQGGLAFQITSPANNSVYKAGETTFTGKASPNTTIKAVNQWGTPMGTTTSGLNGEWSFVRYLGPTATGYDITFTATKGADTQRTVLHLDPEAINVPVAVTSIKDGDTYIPGENILKGTGTPGATVNAVNATNGWNVPMGSAKVDSKGNWELPSRNWGPANDYQIKVTQTNPDKSTSTVTVNVKAPTFTALTVDGVTIGAANGPGVSATFSGKATPGSKIAVKSAVTGSTYQTVTTANNGTWKATRAWDPTYTYKLDFEQKAADGTTDTVNYGSFTATHAE